MIKKVSIKTIFTIQIILLTLIIGLFISYRLNLPRVIIVHSYDLEYGWVQQINQGMREVFAKQPNIILNFQYLNSRNNSSASYMQRAGILMRRLIGNLKPAVIIAVDDDAQDYVGKFYIDDPSVTVIFCAINAAPEEYGYDTAKNITGVTERTPISALKKIIPYLPAIEQKPETIKVVALGDFSKTVKFNKKYFEGYDWSPLNMIDIILVSNFDDWKAAVLQTNQRADCLLLSNFDEVEEYSGSGKYMSADKIIKWTEQNATIPMMGCNGEMVINGGSLAISPSGYEQGEIAAHYALRILNGEDVSALPVLSTSQFLIYMRANALEKFPRMPAIYQEFALGTGKFYVQ